MKIWLYSRGDGRRKNNRMILITVWSNLLRMCIHVQVFHSCFHLSIWVELPTWRFHSAFLSSVVSEVPCAWVMRTFSLFNSWNFSKLPFELKCQPAATGAQRSGQIHTLLWFAYLSGFLPLGAWSLLHHYLTAKFGRFAIYFQLAPQVAMWVILHSTSPV